MRSGRNDAGYELCDLTRRLRSQRFCPACEDRSPALSFLVEAEVRVAQGETAGKICRGAGISEQTYYKWRREYGGLKIDQAKRLKELERENERLKKAVSELTLDKQILKEALSGKY